MTTPRDTPPLTAPAPMMFIGHGSPENALADNAFTRSLAEIGRRVARPAAVAVVSAHWLTRGPRVLCTARPRTIHDFYGFEPRLYEVEYPAPGGLELARSSALAAGVPCDSAWGLDHAAWAVLRHVFPDADVPVFEISLDVTSDPSGHVELARQMAAMRDDGIMIVGSGNVVHNLARLRPGPGAAPYEWAIEFDEWVADRMAAGDLDALVEYEDRAPRSDLAVPTPDHYLPLLYVAALRREDEPIEFTYEGIESGSVSMRCLLVG